MNTLHCGKPSPWRRFTKELRSIRDLWLLCLVIPLVPVVFGPGWSTGAQWQYYVLAACAAALGAASFGQELGHNTLGLLLTQPISRTRVWVEKMGALALALLSVALVALLVAGRRQAYMHEEIVLAFTGVLLTAPALTLMTRNPLAGAAFTLCLPLMLAMGIILLGNWIYAFPGTVIGLELLSVRTWTTCYLVYCVVLCVAGYASFVRTQMTGGPQSVGVGAFAWLGLSKLGNRLLVPRKGLPILNLIAKEIRLHHQFFTLMGMWLILQISVLVTMHFHPHLELAWAVLPIGGYIAAVIIGCGAVSVVEERVMGLHEYRLAQLPAARVQWTVKFITTLLVTLVLAILVPALVVYIAQRSFGALPGFIMPTAAEFRGMIIFVVATTSLGIFCSTIASNALRAGFQFIGVQVGAWALAGWTLFEGGQAPEHIGTMIRRMVEFAWGVGMSSKQLLEVVLAGTFIALTLLCYELGYFHFRRSDAGGRKGLFHSVALSFLGACGMVFYVGTRIVIDMLRAQQ